MKDSDRMPAGSFTVPLLLDAHPASRISAWPAEMQAILKASTRLRELEKPASPPTDPTPADREARSGDSCADETIALIETRFAQAPVCCHCRTRQVQKWGKASGLRRYRCMRCGRTFNALTGSPLARLRRRETWAAFAAALAEGLSIRKAAKRCGIDAATSFRWRRRFSQK